MPRADRSIAFLTGLIIAALYVILLVGFVQESYMRRDAAGRADGAGTWLAVEDASPRGCRIELRACARVPPDRSENAPEAPRFDNGRIPLNLGHRSTTERR